MSKAAVTFLTLLVMCIAIAQLLPAQFALPMMLCEGGAGIFAVLFVIALLIGRRIKFDPVLR